MFQYIPFYNIHPKASLNRRNRMVINMQNIWMTGILLSALVGSGAVMGMGVIDGHNGMHHGMHREHYEDCPDHEECEYESDECLEHSEEECYEEHEDGDDHHQNGRHHEDHDCWE